MGFTVRTLTKICDPLGIGLRIDAWWRSGELDRLFDAGHAALQAHTKQLLERWGWVVQVEVTFARYGERGSVDLLAFHPLLRILLVIEIKTEIVDVQGLLRPLDTKVRLAHDLARRFNWRPATVVPCLVVWDASTARRRVAQHATLFDRFELRGRAAKSWMRRPSGTPRGLLVFTIPSGGTVGATRRPGRLRVRRRSAVVSSPAAPRGARDNSRAT